MQQLLKAIKQNFIGAFYISLFSTIVFFDRLTKWYVFTCQMTKKIITPWLSVDLVFNRGIAWSFFYTKSNFWFLVLSLVITLILVALMRVTISLWQQEKLLLGHTLMLAGGMSNLIDRSLYGAIVDFISIHYSDWYFPVFNVADIAIVIGAGICFYSNFIKR